MSGQSKIRNIRNITKYLSCVLIQIAVSCSSRNKPSNMLPALLELSRSRYFVYNVVTAEPPAKTQRNSLGEILSTEKCNSAKRRLKSSLLTFSLFTLYLYGYIYTVFFFRRHWVYNCSGYFVLRIFRGISVFRWTQKEWCLKIEFQICQW